MKFSQAVAIGTILDFVGLWMLACRLNHIAAFGVVLVSSLILLFFISKAQVNQIKVHLQDDFGLGPDIVAMIPEVMVQFEWKKGRKRIGSDGLARIKEAVRGRQFPISLQLGCHKATIVVDCCLDGVPKLMADGLGFDSNKFNPSADFRGSLIKT
jgi:hypothetical protein